MIQPVSYYEQELFREYPTISWVKVDDHHYTGTYDRWSLSLTVTNNKPHLYVVDRREHTACCICGRLPSRILRYLRLHNK